MKNSSGEWAEPPETEEVTILAETLGIMLPEDCQTRLVATEDGRDLAVMESGDRDGEPIFLLHGTPGARTNPLPRPKVLHQLGVRLITYDRPGYGRSPQDSGRRILESASDVLSIANTLSLGRFAILGRSGGTQHALGCAAMIPEDRLRVTGLLSATAPIHGAKLSEFSGWDEGNRQVYAGSDDDMMTELDRQRELMRENPAALLGILEPSLRPSDRQIVEDWSMRTLLIAGYAEAMAVDASGRFDDARASKEHWGFEPEQIQGPVIFWHGHEDPFNPLAPTRHYAERIRRSAFVKFWGSHFDSLAQTPAMLAYLRDFDCSDSNHELGHNLPSEDVNTLWSRLDER